MGVFTTHIDDILGRGEQAALSKILQFPEQRFGELELRESSFVFVGMELAQESDFSATQTQDEFAKNLQPLPTSPQLWPARPPPCLGERDKNAPGRVGLVKPIVKLK